MMTTIYICDTCGKTFSSACAARMCEISHINDINKKKVELIKMECLDPCDYCARAYYVYGCERNCECEKVCKDYDLFVLKE